MKKEEHKSWETVNKYLSQMGSQFHIMEESIDVVIQRRYLALQKRLIKQKDQFKKLCVRAQENAELLFDDSIDDEEKMQWLIALTTINDVRIYRIIEAFSKLDTRLKQWATIALQHSRMLIQSSLMDEMPVYISSGLGGQGHLLRYFCVYIVRKDITMQPFQYALLKKETDAAIAQHQGIVEAFEENDRFVTVTLLCSLRTNLNDVFESLIDECNLYGNFLQKQVIITNVKKLSNDEINTFLQQKEFQ